MDNVELAKSWWKQDPNTQSHGGRLYIISTDDIYGATVTWDGYTDIYNCFCACEELHIYDLDTFMQRLTELKFRATQHFGDTEWPACAPNIPIE